ncbi:MAG: DUF2298 domain-containing protein [Haloferacaceae archaeon]
MEFGLVVRWLVAYALLGAAGLPVAARLFPRLDGRGAGFALPVALVVLTTAAYWVGHVAFGPVALVAGVLALLAVAAVAGLDRDALRRGEVRVAPDLDVDRQAVSEVAVVFVAAFFLLVAVRNADPAVHAGGGEKFLDFGLLKSLDRAGTLPPEDMWFANEPVRYYYGGHLMASLLGDLTLTATKYTYNLALAGLYATLVAAAYELGGALAAERGAPRRLGGGLAAFLVGVASNLAPPVRFAVSLLPPSRREQAARLLARTAHDYDVGMILRGPASFSYWDASRIIPGTINEFPLFAWLNGDLHAHMMGTPFVLLAAALAFSYYRTPEAEVTRRRVLVFVAVPVLAGLQAVVDTWSFPTVFGLLWLSLVFAPASPLSLLPVGDAVRRRATALAPESRLADEFGRVAAALATVSLAGALGFLLASPFLLSSASGRTVALLAASDRSGLWALLLVHGAFVLPMAAYLVRRLRFDGVLAPLAGFAAVVFVALRIDLQAAIVVVPLLVLGWVTLRMGRDVGFETVLVVAGAGLVALVELVYVKEQAGPGRMNTVFKTYMQVWVLWGTTTGAVLAAALAGRLSSAAEASAASFSPFASSGRSWLPTSVTRPLGRVLVGALVLSTAIYGGAALGVHFGTSDWNTLDATQFTHRYHPGEADAIDYLDAREGAPTMASAPATWRYPLDASKQPAGPGLYRWQASPAASLTGVPTLAGWHHEVGYRGPEAYFARVRDTDLLYTGTPVERANVMRAYDVEYVWVGPAERTRYGSVSFENVSGVTPVFEDEKATVYRVNRSELPAG